MNTPYPFKKIVIGGTFDHLHLGHEAFLERAFNIGKKVTIGLVSDFMVKEKISGKAILPYPRRLRELRDFLRRRKFLPRAEIVTIYDPFGPSVEDNRIEAILVTTETIGNARKINLARVKKGFPSLKIIIIPFVKGTDRKRISSTRIRLGEEDRQGRVFTSRILALGGRVLPREIRRLLKKPFGTLYSLGSNNHPLVISRAINQNNLSGQLVITVGDVVTSDFIQAGVVPSLAIVDLRIGREKIFSSISALGLSKRSNICHVINKPGYVSLSLFSKIARAFTRIRQRGEKEVICVSGQEDLAVLPAILLAPMGSFVIYGQPGQGFVVVEVLEKTKLKTLLLLSRFRKK